ncbi:MAG: phospho-N-acetylmuramoyl-pentapeptide-transferase [Desulfovibrio sp.]|jgi:phospho-N-acetylmuramoyl-pentapeptide-transferase|nr:phospho-N-acetylmuramoyl-pentapeptide-transferase [Desulfovibrio sp.]MDD7477745.1 phospho-N-acetylmuramoyl-pentapeptide-transferase [Desulfovibrio sp.]MDY5486738.1 phospho-N-acetylmuramoyl-pentapeptide-transferase [Desulfovibrio sp.]MEE0405418.1 phospho-N-acetylmuramoyl-pentapeptide-transferase [Desulfovibrio sp.]HAK23186.1 phospho-N-acetylmuramoyl-pentapeptide-transferase [Desulfovibrio sp.]
MLYHLLLPHADVFTAFNVFRYITFRSMGALITAMVISVLIGPWCISFLHRIKCGQYILSDVKAHAAKAGTPTMGGLLIMLTVLVSILLWSDLSNRYVWQCMLVFLGYGIIGFWDDMTKLRHHQNKGISPKAKMLGLIIVASVAMWLLQTDPSYTTKLYIPFAKGWTPDLGVFYFPFGVFVMVASSNAVNLTDGLDGLAIGPTVLAGAVFAIFIYITGNARLTQYLYLPYIPGVGEVTVFCGAFIGAGLGFLWFNAYPAQVFMGDVGSLSLGGTLGFLALLCKQELIMVVVGGIFVAETLSVILQVSYFKWTHGKRIFRMAPLHHHFELKGIPESKIIIRFWITSIILGLVALSTIKLR